MTLVSRQCNNATLTELALATTYKVDRNKGNLINSLNRLKVVCYKSDDGGLPYKPYKVVVAVKLCTTSPTREQMILADSKKVP